MGKAHQLFQSRPQFPGPFGDSQAACTKNEQKDDCKVSNFSQEKYVYNISMSQCLFNISKSEFCTEIVLVFATNIRWCLTSTTMTVSSSPTVTSVSTNTAARYLGDKFSCILPEHKKFLLVPVHVGHEGLELGDGHRVVHRGRVPPVRGRGHPQGNLPLKVEHLVCCLKYSFC